MLPLSYKQYTWWTGWLLKYTTCIHTLDYVLYYSHHINNMTFLHESTVLYDAHLYAVIRCKLWTFTRLESSSFFSFFYFKPVYEAELKICDGIIFCFQCPIKIYISIKKKYMYICIHVCMVILSVWTCTHGKTERSECEWRESAKWCVDRIYLCKKSWKSK